MSKELLSKADDRLMEGQKALDEKGAGAQGKALSSNLASRWNATKPLRGRRDVTEAEDGLPRLRRLRGLSSPIRR